MAEQQEPVRRMVALKILKAGMDTKEFVARFEAGRQALALMDHPNIARVLDGGATASGRPYVVMELVKGIAITDFCEQHQLPTGERLRLFMKVCAGVQHAHQKGVIHRDLKPNNVLVTLHDSEPVPKVNDFGIAKALGQKLTERTLFTRFEQLIGTPAYMSPEQAEWNGLDIDTRSDLYSLGVLLYELLTGSTPLEKETLARAALDEMRRMIREVEPPKPSTRLEAGLRGQKSEVGGRKAEVSSISRPAAPEPQLPDSASLRRRLHAVRGDLDWIVMKALEKDRTRRYETVNGLARDVERHLNGEPVVACPPTQAYRAGKFIRKHRVGVAAVSGVALVLVVGLVLVLVGFAQVRRERQRAREEAAKANAISDFLREDLLAQGSPMNATNRDVTVREVVDRAAAKIAGRFTNQPVVEAAIRQTLGQTYLFQDQYAAAEVQLQRAFETYTRTLGPEHEDTLKALDFLVASKTGQGKFSEAEPLVRHFVETCRRTKGPVDRATLHSLFSLALWYDQQGRADDSVPIYRELLEKQRQVYGRESVKNVEIMNNLANDYNFLGRPREAVSLFEETLSICRRDNGPMYSFTTALRNLGLHYVFYGDYRRAAELLKESVDVDRLVWGPQNPLTLMGMSLLSHAYGAIGSWKACVSLCREGAQCTNELKLWKDFTYQGAVAALLVGDTNAFHEFAGRLAVQFAATTNADWARATAEICLLTPDALPDLQPVFRLAELATKSDDVPQMNQIARGMAEYRRGHLDEASRWFEAPRRGCAPSSAASQAGYFCAMIHQRQGDNASARANLDEAAQQLAAYLRSGLYWDWHEYGRVVAVRAEAERLILGREVSTLLGPAELESGRKHWAPVHQRLAQATTYTRRERWKEASAECLAAQQESVFTWDTALNAEGDLPRAMGITFLLAKDRQSRDRLSRSLFRFLEEHPDPFLACDVVEICLAAPDAATNAVFRKAITWSAPLEGTSNRVNLVRMLMAYRAGRFDEAVERAKAAERSEGLAVQGATQLFRAMSLAKLGRTDEGRQAFQAAEARLGPEIAKPHSDNWCDLGLCQLALDEAYQLFGIAPPK